MKKIILLIGIVMIMLVGCQQKYDEGYNEGYEQGKQHCYNKDYYDGYEKGYMEGLIDGKSLCNCMGIEELIKDIDIFYTSDEKLEDKYIQREWWGFYHNNTDFYDMANGKYCEIAIWNFTDAMIFNRGNYYARC